MNSEVDFYFTKGKWQQELHALRMIVHDAENIGYQLSEKLKWGVPCYDFEGKNIVLMHVFKDYCALLFFKGVMINDSFGILIPQTENVQAARQIRFKSLDDIIRLERKIKAYIREAVEVEKAGFKVQFKNTSDYVIPEEFQQRLDASLSFKSAFENLTPGRQRAYIFYFSQPKQPKTRMIRVEKCLQRILEGKGLND